MANIRINMPEKLALQFSKLEERTDEVINACLEEGGKEALGVVKASLSRVIGSGTKLPSKSTGELMGALGVSPPGVDFKGIVNVKIGFREPRKGQKATNAMIANVLEHGRHGQPAKPFLKTSRSKARKAAIEAMQSKFESEISKL